MIWYIVVFLIVWTIASVWYFIANMGCAKIQGHREPWWSWFFAPPAICIAFVVGIYGKWTKR